MTLNLISAPYYSPRPYCRRDYERYKQALSAAQKLDHGAEIQKDIIKSVNPYVEFVLCHPAIKKLAEQLNFNIEVRNKAKVKETMDLKTKTLDPKKLKDSERVYQRDVNWIQLPESIKTEVKTFYERLNKWVNAENPDLTNLEISLWDLINKIFFIRPEEVGIGKTKDSVIKTEEEVGIGKTKDSVIKTEKEKTAKNDLIDTLSQIHSDYFAINNVHSNPIQALELSLKTTPNQTNQALTKLDQLTPLEKIKSNLFEAFEEAITKIVKELEADGVKIAEYKQVLDSLDPKKNQPDIEQINILKNFLWQIQNEQMKYASSNKRAIYRKLGQLEQIIEAHRDNLNQVKEIEFTPTKIEQFNRKIFAQLDKPVNSLSEKLTTYLDNRAKDQRNNKVRQYQHGHFGCFQLVFFQKSYDQKEKAVKALQSALRNEKVDLLEHLPTLRNGTLGTELRKFIKAGYADTIVDKEVRTVSDFIKALDAQVNSQLTPLSPN
ncbi:hypothetical protein ACNVED_11575 [Legionella sp. D16C41]|uniref:hypothetical protein n=1 Tax=Legionella sp. D16C41 TaxID=3402688 RepID=UPI003AF4A5BE